MAWVGRGVEFGWDSVGSSWSSLAAWSLVNPLQVLSLLSGSGGTLSPQTQSQPGNPNDQTAQFARAVLGDTEDTWSRIFQQQLKAQYQPAKLVLFEGGVDSACGFAQTAMGPFYCPRDQKIYLDMNFFRQIQAAAGPNADFARAYAIAHEVGHHIQDLLGISDQVQRKMQSSDSATANAYSVRLELQADCFAGVWGHYTQERGLINDQDVRSALSTAAQIGDDYLQKRATGRIVPDAFTHGSSQQRVNWFERGFSSGDMRQCNTFAAKSL
ncbi:MAG: zinc metallopeptidase [Thermaceae bacterium]|nr:zinc metallopeptidase [Thermaceae bacterium]